MLGTAWDITEIRRLAIQLDTEKERLLTERAALLARTTELHELSTLQRAILTDAAVGIIATDTEGTITLFNPAAERMSGYAAEDLVGRATPNLFHDAAEIAATRMSGRTSIKTGRASRCCSVSRLCVTRTIASSDTWEWPSIKANSEARKSGCWKPSTCG
jgi:PAS domain-containing protein